MRTRLLVLAAALVLCAPAASATPQVDARAWLVENGATGEVLLSHDAGERVPIASITKLMTVLLTMEHTQLGDVVTVAPQAAAVGESSAGLRAGERITVRDLLEAALIQSANDAADSLAYYVGDGSMTRFVAMMNARARTLGLHDTHFVRPDGLDAPGHVSSARDVTKLARVVMQKPAVREIVRQKSAVISGGRVMRTWNDLLGVYPGVIGVKTGHTSLAGWSQVAAVRGRGLTIYATILGSPSRTQRNADLENLLSYGLSRYVVVRAIRNGRVYAKTEVGYGRKPVTLVATKPLLHVVRVGRPLVEVITAPPVATLPVLKGQKLGEVSVYAAGKLLGTRPLVATRTARRPGFQSRVSWYAGQTAHHLWGFVVILTVTLNAAVDRTLTVPNVQLGHRHRAVQVLTIAGGKGINVARALKRLDVPVIATGLAGGRTGTRLVEELTAEGILNDLVRIGQESRTSTAVVDPARGTYTEINEWGPQVSEEELAILTAKLHYLSRGADYAVLAGSLPRAVDVDFYAEAIRDFTRRNVPAVLVSEGEPLRRGIEAEPYLVAPRYRDAEAVVGQEFGDDEDYVLGLDSIAEMGAKNVIIMRDDGCYARLREDKTTRRFKVTAPEVERVSAVGVGDVTLAAFLAARLDGKPVAEALRTAVAAGAASTLELGAGRFEPREANKLVAGVELVELAPAAV